MGSVLANLAKMVRFVLEPARTDMPLKYTRQSTGSRLWVPVLLFAPFYLNDFASIFVNDWRLWLFIDYVGVKLFPCAVVLWLICDKKMQPQELGLTPQRLTSFLKVFLLVAFVGTVIDQNAYQWLAKFPGYSRLGDMPVIESPAWNWIDLTSGLFMVGLVEELVFRGYMHKFLRNFTESPSAIVAVSSIAFGLIHWSLGLHAVLITSTIGALFMVAYMKTRSLPSIMLAHFAIDFIDFAGIVPKSIFKLV